MAVNKPKPKVIKNNSVGKKNLKGSSVKIYTYNTSVIAIITPTKEPRIPLENINDTASYM